MAPGAGDTDRDRPEGAVVWAVLADLVMVGHFAFVVFAGAGGLLVWRWPRVALVHIPALGWGVAIITVGFTCPLTPLEKTLRARAGEAVYEGGFVDRYIEGVIYPGELTDELRLLAAAVTVVGYALLWRRLRRRRHGARPDAGTRATVPL